MSVAQCGVRPEGVHPDCVIHVRRDVLEEVDGSMLKHGLQGLEGLADFGAEQAVGGEVGELGIGIQG